MLLRAALYNKGNPFQRYARKRLMVRADFTEKELQGYVKPHVNEKGHWTGPFPEDYLQYTDYTADIAGSNHPGYSPWMAYGLLGGMFVGLYSLYKYYQAHPELGGERPYVRKQFPYNALYLERGGDPSKLHLLPPIDSEVYDPYPYYGENSIDAKKARGEHVDSHH